MSHTVFAPHGMCMMWNTRLIWLSVVTDALIALAYYSIPAALFLVVKKRPEAGVPFRPLLLLFGLFIAFCGAGHLMDIVSIWKPIYWLKGYWNGGTALTSVVTAFVLIPKVAGFIQMPEVTARLQQEKKMIEERHGLLQSVLDSVTEGILLVGPGGQPLAYNSAAASMLGAGLASFRYELLPQERTIEERSDGSVIEHSTRLLPHIGQLHVARDLTEERRTNAALLELQHVIATMRQGFATVSLETCAVEVANPAMAALHGFEAGTLVGVPAIALHAGTELERTGSLAAIRDAAEQDGFWEGEVNALRKDGLAFPAQVRVNLHETAKRQFVSVIETDITEQKALAASAAELQAKLLQSQKLESLGVMAGGIAHDFNNLLTGMLGNASLLVDSLPAQGHTEDRELAENILNAAERAAGLTRQMLAYSGKGRFEVRPTDLSVQVREILPLIKPMMDANAQVQLNLADQLPEIEADPGQMQQLIMNLIINGAEALGGAQGQVTVTTEKVFVDDTFLAQSFSIDNTSPGHYVKLEVQDTGCGMDEETKAKIFDPFFTTKFTGRGLGLAAVSGIIRGHKGALKVYSSKGQGTTFQVFLPAIEKHDARDQPVYIPDLSEHRGQGTVLLVDDEEIIRKVGQASLERQGYQVLLAKNGLEAIQLFESRHSEIVLIVLDMTMPVMGGEQALGHLRKIDPSTPIVACSGYNQVEVIRKLISGGVSGFLQKPYTYSSLIAKVRQVLEAAPARPAEDAECGSSDC